jgi:uncharacterized protein (DUF697 family)
MARMKDITSIWTNIKEIDLKPSRDAALNQVKIALVGRLGSGRHALAELLRRDPARPQEQTLSPLAILPLESADGAAGADLIILLVDLTQADITAEQALSQGWNDRGKKILVLGTNMSALAQSGSSGQWPYWPASRVLYGSLTDLHFITRSLAPAILELLPDQHLALGRQFPLFRLPVARQMISETCFSNTAYAISTGLAEIVPVLDLPLNVTDMIILTKSQAFLAYKLGLALGFSTRWQDYIAEFGSVIGGGFLWRQLARSLVGLIPVWGIVPKVAVSYAGTYVVGNTILQWYLTGRHLSPRQMGQLYRQAFSRGKDSARRMLSKLHRPRLGKGTSPELPAGESQFELPAGAEGAQPPADAALPLTTEASVPVAALPAATAPIRKPRRLPRRKAKPPKQRLCPACQKISAGDAVFCQYCGTNFDQIAGE